MRIGIGFDAHRFAEGRPLILGGVRIDYHLGLLGHSDADVLTHAIMDAILGAMGEGDIGRHFPDTDAGYKGVDSLMLLKEVAVLMAENDYRLVNLDAIVMAEAPKLISYWPAIKDNLSPILRAELERINVKATTTEGMGFIGRGEGMAAQAAVILEMI
ncbi:MAG: 2-C-methyl-D-erythritol 2,4-cyclodiphosphate synthase [Actinomycetota bacterium]|nr:2-C-methyl-D-erythritol 2,4-cyclodiphosphate synthase [Actinomycetota bacterium]